MSTKLDLDDSNVFMVNMTVEEAREFQDSMVNEDFDLKLDEAQGHVFGGVDEKSYLIIEITKG